MMQLQDRRTPAMWAEDDELDEGFSGGAVSHAVCQGCRERPDRACAACGAPASIWTEAGDGRHVVAWCAPCHELLVSGRPANAQPLVYVPVDKALATA